MRSRGVSRSEIWLRQRIAIMFYVYCLLSIKNKDLYIGYSDNLKRRFREHNKGSVKATKGYRPWVLIYYEAYRAKKDASMREKQLKMHIPKQELKTQLTNSIMSS
jgi:putative endonuclease